MPVRLAATRSARSMASRERQRPEFVRARLALRSEDSASRLNDALT
jgi:hypothetical protein